MYNYIIFDFDGTIADSDKVVNEILSNLAIKYRIHNLSPKEFKHKSELSLIKKIKMLLFIHKVETEFKIQYGKNVSSIKAFDNVLSIINQINKAGYKLAVISSNTKPNIDSFFRLNNISFDIIVLSSKGLFGKHKSITNFLQEHNCTKDSVLYIGDEIRDIKACNKSGVDIAFVKWGLDGNEDISAFKPKFIISTPEELLGILLEK
jgi:phosphoglycolate phosphatase